MCTKPRIIVPGVYYQIYSKGVSGEKILKDRKMKEFFLKELAISLEKYAFQCCSWSVMDDHYHLVVKSSEVPISKFMQRLNSVYAKKFNRENKREGVVFFRRYASVISEETELKKLIRYVHLNPVRCGLCTLEQLDHHEWSGHGAVVQGSDGRILDKDALLAQFPGSDPLSQYRDYINSEKADGGDELIRIVRNANRGKVNFSKWESWVIGSEHFVLDVLQKDRSRRARIARHIMENATLEKLHESLQLCFVSEREQLYRQGRINQKSTCRELFAYVGACRYDFHHTEIAEYLGITGSGVSRMISRYPKISQQEYLVGTVCRCLSDSQSVS
ncbi:MAG: transposase [Chitinispirillaceae bacterium]